MYSKNVACGSEISRAHTMTSRGEAKSIHISLERSYWFNNTHTLLEVTVPTKTVTRAIYHQHVLTDKNRIGRLVGYGSVIGYLPNRPENIMSQ
jgi:hypothetical protein